MKKIIFVLSIYAAFLFCSFAYAQMASENKLFSTVPSSHTGITFRNDIIETPDLFYYKYEYLYIGAGVSVGDINNDGLQDIYFSSTMGFNKLYLNLGNFQFKDITESAGVDGGMGIKSGVNMIDINNDGWLDIFVCKSGPFEPKYRKKIFYINNGDGTFTDKAKEYGLDEESYTTQVYFFDYDRDGDMDVYFVNHPGEFTTAMLVNAKMVNGKLVPVDDTARTYVSDRLYENRNGKFVDVSKKAGVMSHAFGLSAAIFDFDNDGWPDIYVANDFNKPDYLYINNRNGTFTDKLSDYFNHISLSSMGSDLNDINNDGLEDLFVLDMAIEDPVRQKQLFVQNLNYDKFQLMVKMKMYHQYPRNTLQLNTGNGYSEIGYQSGIAQTDWSWTPLIVDYDNDGWKDIYVTNGLKRDISDWDYKNFVLDSVKNLMAKGIAVNLADWFSLIPQVRVKNFLYRNNGSLRFDNYSEIWSDEPPSFSNGAAYADLDNDGDLDIIVNNIDDEAFVLRNNQNEKNNSHFLRFRFYQSREIKKEVYGASVKLYDANNNIQMQRYDPQRGYMSTVEHFLHFGTGSKNIIPKAEIFFPSGKQIVLTNIAADQVLTVYESDAMTVNNPPDKKNYVFKETTPLNKFRYIHRENDFIDFKREPLIPYRCSRKGPYYTMADVNGDKREDIFIGGAKGYEAVIMIQNEDGSFTEKKQAVFTADKNYEDAGVLFFDADGDGDADLYVVSGGAEFNSGNAIYQDRLYINDGKGNFKRSSTALPKETNNGSFVLALDFDEDGDMDLFVGGGVMPGKFPLHDKNMLLQNNKGVFRNVTDELAPDLNHTGIVNYAAWDDIDGDKKNELLVTGEWMPVMILKMPDAKLKDFTGPGKFAKTDAAVIINSGTEKQAAKSLSDILGWWSTIKLSDIDHDGDLDILVGNRGLNSKITATMDEPCTVYAKDFDGNGSYDAVLGYYIQGKCYPMYHRDQLIDQMPFMRKKFVRYRHYAGKTLDEIFTEEQKKGMDVFKANCFESGVFLNEGNNNFKFIPFPDMAQFSTISDIVVDDFDGDGTIDIIICGNSSDPDVGTGSYDAMAALFLKGSGEGQFTAVPSSGLVINGEVRKIIPVKKNSSLIFLKNNAPAQVFSKN